MYEYFDIDLENISFEWDEKKDQDNFSKHGIHFKTAAKVFLDPDKLIREDEEHKQELRLISARLATVPEKERYEHGEDVFE